MSSPNRMIREAARLCAAKCERRGEALMDARERGDDAEARAVLRALRCDKRNARRWNMLADPRFDSRHAQPWRQATRRAAREGG